MVLKRRSVTLDETVKHSIMKPSKKKDGGKNVERGKRERERGVWEGRVGSSS